MPLYEYVCENCDQELEVLQKFSDKPLTQCPNCNQESLKKKTSKSAFHLKGGGWYKDGYNLPDSDSNTSEKGSNDSDSNTAKDDSTKTKSEKSEPVKTEKGGSSASEKSEKKKSSAASEKTKSVPDSKAS